MTVKIDDVNNAIFNLNDLKETLKAHKLRDIKRVHEGTANEDTIVNFIIVKNTSSALKGESYHFSG